MARRVVGCADRLLVEAGARNAAGIAGFTKEI